MQELIFKNHLKVLFIILAGLIASSAVTHAGMSNVDVPLPLLILGTLAAFLASCFVFFSKATTGQTLQITLTGILLNSAAITGSHFLNTLSGMPDIILKPAFILNIDPLVVATGFVFSIIALCVGLKIEDPAKKQPPEQPPEAMEETDPSPQTSEIPPAQEPGQQTPAETEELFLAEKPPLQEMAEIPEGLAPLESMELNDNIEPETKSQTDYIPINIRLVQAVAQKDTEQRGKIGSIGKLLISNKNLDNLIESEEMLDSETTVITTVSGQKIYEKFNEIKSEFSCIKEMALIDEGGFIIANNFEDKQRVQIAGALVAGAYHTLQNYLSQISLAMPVRIFFETENTNSFIVKTREEILFSVWEKDFKQVEYGPMKEIIEADDFENLDIIPYADLIKVEQFAVSDSVGTLVNSMGEVADSQLFAAVSSAIFENIKVFLMNIKMFNLSRIVVFTPKKTITIVKPEDKIVSFLTDAEEYPNVSEELLKMEAI